MLNAVPSSPVNTPNSRYSVPMSLAFVENSQRVTVGANVGTAQLLEAIECLGTMPLC